MQRRAVSWTKKPLGKTSLLQEAFQTISNTARSKIRLDQINLKISLRGEPMMTTEGLILKEQSVGESDKIVTVLTKTHGVIRCFSRRAKKLSSAVSSACQMMTYSRLDIYEGRDKYIVNNAQVIKSFFEAFADLDRLSLGYYICETAIKMIPENMPSEDYLQLVLNCLYAISVKNKPLYQIKAVYELRMMLLSGVCPNILFCCECGAYESDNGQMYFDPYENAMYCPHCCFRTGNAPKCLAVSMGCITAVRFCMTAEPKKILSFTLSPASMQDMEKFCERFFLAQNDFYCPTLDFYKSVKELN